jgi:ABC-type transport system involved in multi-copper enzyme maturation permease subunit
LIELWGGVDPLLVLTGFTITCLTMVSVASLTMLNSVLVSRTRMAIVSTYGAILAYQVFSLTMPILLKGGPTWLSFMPGSMVPTVDGPSWLGAGSIRHTYYRLDLAFKNPEKMIERLWSLLQDQMVFHGFVSLICLAGAIYLMRRKSIEQASRQKRRAFFLALSPRRLPAIGRHPLLWKELYAEPLLRMNRAAYIALGTLVTIGGILFLFLSVFFAIIILIRGGQADQTSNEVVRTLGVPLACLMLLVVAVRASGSLSSERDRNTFDSLLSSPLENQDILFAKWLGSILCVRKLGWGLLALGAAGVLRRGLDLSAFILLCLAWSIFAAFLSGVGLWFSLVSRTTLRANIWTLLAFLGVCIGPLIANALGALHQSSAAPTRTGSYVAHGLPPPVALNTLAYYRGDYARKFGYQPWEEMAKRDRPWDVFVWHDDHETAEFYKMKVGGALFGLMIYLLAAAILWGLSVCFFPLMTQRQPCGQTWKERLRSEDIL